jgi:hypothetical protein
VGPNVGIDAVEERKISSPCRGKQYESSWDIYPHGIQENLNTCPYAAMINLI